MLQQLTAHSIWTAKATVTEFLKRMTERFWKKGYEIGLRVIQGFLVVTFCIVVIVTLAECHPFSHYWQVVPDPGPKCRQGYLNLMTMGISDIITDLLIVCFPIPIIVQSHMPLKRKISLVALFSMSIILIAITGARMPLVVRKRGIQQFRTVFASSEILAATIVSNAIILGSFLRDRGIKKQKYKFGSTNDSMDRRTSSTRRQPTAQLGSDEDLARSLGYKMPADCTEEKSRVVRPAPVANLGLLSPRGAPPPFSTPNWHRRQSEQSHSSADSEMLKVKTIEDPHPSPRTARRVSFFDVGGLLETGLGSTISPSPTDSIVTQDFAHPSRRSSKASNSTVPGARSYPPPARRSSRFVQQPEGIELTERQGQQLQDPGGLLAECDEIEMEQSSASTTSPLLKSRTTSQTEPVTAHPPIVRSATEASYSSFGTMPSLKDAGGLLSSSSHASRR